MNVEDIDQLREALKYTNQNEKIKLNKSKEK